MSFAAEVNGALLRVLEDARRELRCGRNKLTVLSTQVDPYRLDTPAGHRDGAWLAEQLDRAVGAERRIHWRGLHYAIVAAGDIRKPNGEIYRNDDANWTWIANSLPYFGVLSNDKFINPTPDSLAEFFATGDRDVEQTLGMIRRRFGDFTPRSALDFGCGVGRLLIPMAKRTGRES